jgi:predicted amidohydrolase
MVSGPNVGANLIVAERLIGDAVAAGAGLVVLPENFALMGVSERDKVEHRESDDGGPIQRFLSVQATRHRVWLVGGTVPLEAHSVEKVLAATLVYDSHGRCVARYDKMHLFDVRLLDTGEQYEESETTEPGDDVIVVDTPCGRLGIAVCYDLRFPEMFRRMLDEGLEILAVPAAFTAVTGRAHWEILVRARAIENLCYVAAAGQGGYHVGGRETHGCSMIVDPWGSVLDRLSRGSGFIIADFDRRRLNNTRRNFPCLEHRRLRCR